MSDVTNNPPSSRGTGAVSASSEGPAGDPPPGPEPIDYKRALQRSLNAYDTLARLCHAAVVTAGPDGRISSWEGAAEQLFGYSEDEALGRPLEELFPERLRAPFLDGFRRSFRSPEEEPQGRIRQSYALCRDGSEVPIEICASAGQEGSKEVFTAVIRDVSEHRRIIDCLNDALQRLQFHVERMPLAYIVWDVGFRVVEWNPAAERIFGYRKSEAVGKHAYELIVPPDAVATVDEVWAKLLEGDTSSFSANPNVHKDGTELTCEWFNTPLRDAEGKVRGVASMAMDVSEREAVEAQLRNAQKLESLGVLASGAAHDFNSSLMVILGNTALLRSIRGLPRKARDSIELIEEAGFRAKEFVNHLLAYARTGRHNPQPANLNAIVEDALTLVSSSIGEKHVLNVDLAEELPTIRADHSQIEQVILNLCLNADQALGEEGTIGITTRTTALTPERASRCVPPEARPGRYVELLVKDNGSGMDPATVPHIFDPFFTTKTDGHGLGLAAVLGILRQHGAFALVESVIARGSEIHVFFPIREAAAPTRG